MHTQLTFELASSDGQIPAVYQRALQLGKNKELATTLAERRLKISRENFQHLYELLSLDSIAAVLYYALQFLFSCCINLDQYGQLVVFTKSCSFFWKKWKSSYPSTLPYFTNLYHFGLLGMLAAHAPTSSPATSPKCKRS